VAWGKCERFGEYGWSNSYEASRNSLSNTPIGLETARGRRRISGSTQAVSFLVKAQTAGQDGKTNGISSGNLRPLAAYLPHCSNRSILITTRSEYVALQLVEQLKMITIEPMNKANALELFAKKLGRDDGGDDATKLATALEFLPLAIVQAAVYVSQRAPRSSVREYL
jgi:hypothetical protein